MQRADLAAGAVVLVVVAVATQLLQVQVLVLAGAVVEITVGPMVVL
jgi:hypothetical protein